MLSQSSILFYWCLHSSLHAGSMRVTLCMLVCLFSHAICCVYVCVHVCTCICARAYVNVSVISCSMFLCIVYIFTAMYVATDIQSMSA